MSSKISKHINKNNLHHAYLIEGIGEEILPEILEAVEDLGIKTVGNSDFVHLKADSFKVEDARNLKSFSREKANSAGRQIFVISANNFLLEAQNTLLKMFEEPIENTHFFLVVPDVNALLKTFASRFYVIKPKEGIELKEAEEFIKTPLQSRINFIKELVTEAEVPTEVGIPTGVGKDVTLDSARSKALRFLNAVESVLHKKFVNNFSGLLHPSDGTFPVQNSLQICLHQIFKVREFLRQPGSSVKNLMESVALIIPVL